jgi:hypothetical protein
MTAYSLPDLPYSPGALEPHYSGEIVDLHHSKHHAAYVKGANDTLAALEAARAEGDFSNINQLSRSFAFHVSGHVLHSIFWTNMSPDGGGKPEGELDAAITEHFGSFDALQAQLTAATVNVQGIGWGALAWEPVSGRLDRRADLRPPGQRRRRLGAAAGHRLVGARLLPAVQEREGRLREGLLEHRQLAQRRRALRCRPHGAGCHLTTD